MSEFDIASGSDNLTVALALAKAGLPIFPAEVTFNEKKQKWDKEPLIKGWQAGSHHRRGKAARVVARMAGGGARRSNSAAPG